MAYQQERKRSCRKLSLTTQALRHLLPSPSPVDMMTDRLGEQGDTEPPNDDPPLIAERCLLSAPAEMEHPLCVWKHSDAAADLLPGGWCHSRQDDSPSLPGDILHPGCPDLPLTLEGATDPVSFNSLFSIGGSRGDHDL
ncbi:uncharacterized protein LOC135525829 isoform X3 [Oncorhynchus masou masou]|uniref:uncharacterized protein LOC135525829 isoform X3 n=1 Tax=Oncorhynchus masou masou TaxID=90313 RepID=UPI003183D760